MASEPAGPTGVTDPVQLVASGAFRLPRGACRRHLGRLVRWRRPDGQHPDRIVVADWDVSTPSHHAHWLPPNQLDSPSPMNQASAVSRLNKLGAIVLLSIAAALPESIWLLAHAFGHHVHEASAKHDHGAVERPPAAELATVLVHRHSHDDNVPDHEHHLSPAPPAREAGPRGLNVALSAQSVPPTHCGSVGEVRSAPGARRPAAGSGPPLLALLCTLRV